jgi:hypothetical protein
LKHSPSAVNRKNCHTLKYGVKDMTLIGRPDKTGFMGFLVKAT